MFYGSSLRTAEYFRSSLPPKNKVCKPERQNDFRGVKPFVFDVDQSDQRIEYSSSNSSRPRALACLTGTRLSVEWF